jgi:hypothetical protein
LSSSRKEGDRNSSEGVDEIENVLQNVRPSRRRQLPNGKKKKIRKGVDGNENYPIMCGSLGRFGDKGKEVKG